MIVGQALALPWLLDGVELVLDDDLELTARQHEVSNGGAAGDLQAHDEMVLRAHVEPDVAEQWDHKPVAEPVATRGVEEPSEHRRVHELVP